MWLLLILVAMAFPAQGPSDRADVTFVNDTKFTVSVFVKASRRTLGPIEPGDFVQLPQGFALGENDYVVLRTVADRRTLSEYAAVAPARHRLYRASEGRGPSPVTIEIRTGLFATLSPDPADTPLIIENNTAYPVYAVAHGRASPFGPILPGRSVRFDSAISAGRRDFLVVAYSEVRPDGRVSSEITDVAFLTLEARQGATTAPVLVVGDRSFGDRGLPPTGSGPVITPARRSLDGKWLMPDGLSVRFEGANGYWLEVKHLAEFGFKSGDHGFRLLREDPPNSGTFVGEVLYQFRGGAIDGWKPFTVSIKDDRTLVNTAGEWKRIE